MNQFLLDKDIEVADLLLRKGDETGLCLHEMFEVQADKTPDAPALVCGDLSLSYGELDAAANRLAHCLRKRGARPGSFVGLCLERSSELPVVAILACLKAGAAYAPIEPSFPDERIRYIAGEAGIELLLTEKSLADRLRRPHDGALLLLDACGAETRAAPATRLSRIQTGVTPRDACYVIYTSGTTGRPKGVVAEHRNVAHFVKAFNAVCATTPEDRIYQGFALSFDGSVEEIWMAFSNGAALVAPSREAPRFGNDLARHLAAAGVTYFSTVPTMLSTMTEDAPSLRQIVVSGEVCPPELVSRWARPGRLMLNVYGPTETTVNATAAVCEPGRPVTIGRPLDGYTALVLDHDMRPVPPGERGELYVGGAGVARGYLKQPELTRRSFVALNDSTRLYRTGDLASLREDGEIEFFGRADGQVKVRGYRVELSEIEQVLLEQEAIAGAAAAVFHREGGPTLAAFVTLADGAAPLDRRRVLAALRARLPAYMTPAYLDVLDDFPRLTSGKTDRKRLPEPQSPLVDGLGAGARAATPLEARIADVWAEIFKVGEVGAEQDFFLDLGGHSLLAARTVALLRSRADIHIPVRDVYSHPTVRRMAAHVEAIRASRAQDWSSRNAPAEPAPTPEPVLRKPDLLLAGAQMSAILLLLAVMSLPLVVVLPAFADMMLGRTPLLDALVFFTPFGLALWPALLAAGIAGKWLIIGRYRAGAYPLWGSYYFRWWLVSRLQALSGAGMLVGTPLMPLYYRLMGAKVGRRCALDTALCSAWDLVSIGDDSSIGADTQLLGVRIENGCLILGGMDIGDRCFVGLHSALGLNVKMGNDARLDDQSFLPDGECIPAGEARRGSPARAAEVAVPEGSVLRCSWLRLAFFTIAQVFAASVLGLLTVLPGAAFLIALVFVTIHLSAKAAVLLVLAATPLFVAFACLWIAMCKAVVLRRARPGVYPLRGLQDLRVWLAAGLMRVARSAMLPVFTTLYLPPWMRLLGARIGRFSEMSTVFAFLPDLLKAGDGSFFADGAILGGRRAHCGRFEIATNSVGRRSFIGNSAILPPGSHIGDDSLLGVLSSPPERTRRSPDGADWLGSPGFRLPNRQKVGGFDDTVTYSPTASLYAQRAVIDALRILIPVYTGTTLMLAGLVTMILLNETYGPWAAYAAVLPMLLAMAGANVAVVVGLKWLVMGVFRPVIKPLWSPYVWFNEMINGAYETMMAPVVGFFFGTPVAPWLLRLLGCGIGRYCYIGTTLFSEFDLVRIGDHVALNGGAVIQNHLFEDRVMKSSYLTIGDGCSVGNMAVALYDAHMEDGAVLGTLSLLMKGEIMPAGTRWHGVPTVQG